MREGEIINPPASGRGFGVRHVQILLQILLYIIIMGIEASLSITLSSILTDPKAKLFNELWKIPYLYDIVNILQRTGVSSGGLFLRVFAKIPSGPVAFLKLSRRRMLRGLNLPIYTVSRMLQSYIIGFIITEVFGGFVSRRYGFKWPMVIFMTIISAVTLNLPTLTNEYGVIGISGCRIVQGLCTGVLFAMPADAISRWVPVRERTILGTAVYASGFLGVALSLFAGTYISRTNLDWSFIFTQIGYLSIIWVVLMVVFGADSPEQYSRKISDSELEYIVLNRGNVTTGKKVKIPWRQILTSMPFWAIVVAQMGDSWMLVVLTLNMPLYMSFKFDVHLSQHIIASIYLITWILSFSISGIAQLLITEGRTTIGQSRKLFNTLGSCIPAFFFIVLALDLHSNQYVGIAILVIIFVTSVGTICGSKLNVNDITSNFAAIVYGIATWISLIFNMVNVILMGLHDFDDWTFLFTYTAILLIVTNLFYLKFGSVEEQEWSSHNDPEDEEVELSKSTSRASVDEGKYLLYIRKK